MPSIHDQAPQVIELTELIARGEPADALPATQPARDGDAAHAAPPAGSAGAGASRRPGDPENGAAEAAAAPKAAAPKVAERLADRQAAAAEGAQVREAASPAAAAGEEDEKDGTGVVQASLPPLVARMLPGLADRVGGLGHDVSVLHDRLDRLAARQNRLDELNRLRTDEDEVTNLSARIRDEILAGLEGAGKETLEDRERLDRAVGALESLVETQGRDVRDRLEELAARLAAGEERVAALGLPADTDALKEELLETIHALHETCRQESEGFNESLRTLESSLDATMARHSAGLETLEAGLAGLAARLPEEGSGAPATRGELDALAERIESLRTAQDGLTRGIETLEQACREARTGMEENREAMTRGMDDLTNKMDEMRLDLQGCQEQARRGQDMQQTMQQQADRQQKQLDETGVRLEALARATSEKAAELDRGLGECRDRLALDSLEARLAGLERSAGARVEELARRLEALAARLDALEAGARETAENGQVQQQLLTDLERELRTRQQAHNDRHRAALEALAARLDALEAHAGETSEQDRVRQQLLSSMEKNLNGRVAAVEEHLASCRQQMQLAMDGLHREQDDLKSAQAAAASLGEELKHRADRLFDQMTHVDREMAAVHQAAEGRESGLQDLVDGAVQAAVQDLREELGRDVQEDLAGRLEASLATRMQALADTLEASLATRTQALADSLKASLAGDITEEVSARLQDTLSGAVETATREIEAAAARERQMLELRIDALARGLEQAEQTAAERQLRLDRVSRLCEQLASGLHACEQAVEPKRLENVAAAACARILREEIGRLLGSR